MRELQDVARFALFYHSPVRYGTFQYVSEA
jgi:hypothetical protein